MADLAYVLLIVGGFLGDPAVNVTELNPAVASATGCAHCSMATFTQRHCVKVAFLQLGRPGRAGGGAPDPDPGPGGAAVTRVLGGRTVPA